ncbi:MAG TPA: DUF6603 domain-containing protein, partial [Chitinophaga sp.]|nr:DUF6603 domain-containing protein [Chitinophaga sp.]
DAANFSKQSDLSRELLPSFFPGDGDLGAKVGSWLLDVIKVVLPRYVSVLVLNIDKIKTWLETPIVAAANAPTPAILLEAMSLIVNDNNRYSLNTIDNLSKLTPGSFFGNLLLTLMKNKLTLLTFGTDNKGSIVVGPKDGTPDYYGVRLVAPNLKLAAIPNLVLQLGDNTPGNDEWIVKSGGKPGDPGIGFYLPVKSDNGNVSVDFGLFMMMLYNLGFDFVGTNGKPLVDLSRFKIGSVKPRAVFGLDFKGSNAPDVYFGAGITLDDIRISLSPASLASGGGNNPIANNILGSGTTDKYSNPPTDPAFSVTTAYSSNLWVNLKSSTGNGNEVILPVQRAFGPLYIDSLGLGWEDQQKLLDFLFTGSVDLAGLKASVVGLRVGVPVTTPTNFSAYTVDLDGLDISFRGGAVEINGGFVKTEITDGANTYVSYNGVAVIKAGTFSLMALGSYAEVPVSPNPGADTAPSLFIFAVLNAPLGGVPAFFITGVAAGFSFNRSIQIPNITEVQDFPLLKGLVDGSFAEGEDPGKALVALSAVVKPEVGQYWLAAGIKFTSFELITSSALLFFSFGKDWEVNLLGLSFASLPPRIPKSLALAYFELAIKVSFKPELGIISAEAQLTPNSFVLSNDCKVTGGFAFFLWYKTIVTKDYIIPAGDFVISLGGYHPSFQKPVYYPEVPRLGLQWKMDISVGSISIGGGAYFALCPTAVMAGGYINVAYQLGPLKAWLSAYANFLIEWKPFYFNVDIGITVGASFGTTIAGVSLTIKAELGAQLHLEGPPTHGHVHVDWYVISFTIPIGSGTTATDDKNLTWAAFADSFLPPPEAPETRSRNGVRLLNADPVQQVVKWAAEAGLQSENNDLWSIQPYPFSFSLKTSIPASLTTVANSDYSQPGIKVGVRPMGMMTDLNSPLTITITNAKGEQVNLKERNIRISAFSNGAPGALWSKDGLNKRQPPDPSKMLIPDASFGLVFDGDQYVFIGEVIPFPIINLAYTLGDPKLLPFKNTPGYPAAARYPDSDQATAYQVIMNSIMLPATVTRRNEVYTALQQSSIEAPLDPDLTVMASSANFILQALPVIARIGIYQNGGMPETARLVKRNAARSFAAPAETPLVEPRLLGMLKRYKVKRNTDTGTRGAGRSLGVKSSWQHAGGLTRKNIPQSQTMKRGLTANTKTLYDGSVALWATDNRAMTTLQLDGNLPVRVISFDAHGAILSYRYVAGEKSFSLPQGTAQVAVQGYEAGETMITGWQKDTHLSKVNGVWSLGDAAMIRVQNSQRIHVRSAHAETGVIDTAKLLRENYALGLDDQPVKGWIQAVFPATTGYLGVKIDKDAAPDIWITVDSIPGGSGTKKELVKKVTLTDGFLFIYQVPAAGTHPEYYGILATVRDQDSQITGMYGFSELPKSAKTKLKDLSLNNAGLDLSAETVSTVKVSIQSKL